jgi:hypothetical protein
MRRALFAALCSLQLLSSASARADVSSWLSAGGGYGIKENRETSEGVHRGAMSFTIGVGSDPTRSVVIGGLLRSTTYLSLGTDLGIAARFASGTFARGQWGFAVDVGPMWRSFGSGQYGRWPIAGMLVAGAPWGVQLAVGGELFRVAGGDANARGVVALLEIDLLRLTVMRQGGTDRWWENPSPAGGRRQAHALSGLLF